MHEDTILFPEDENWRLMEADVGRVDSGFHKYILSAIGSESPSADLLISVGLKIAHLVRFANDASKRSVDIPIPSNLEYTKVVSRVKDIEEVHAEYSTVGLQRAKEHMKKMVCWRFSIRCGGLTDNLLDDRSTTKFRATYNPGKESRPRF